MERLGTDEPKRCRGGILLFNYDIGRRERGTRRINILKHLREHGEGPEESEFCVREVLWVLLAVKESRGEARSVQNGEGRN